jgi:hypothetical protein
MTITKVQRTDRLKLLFLQKRIEEEVCAKCPNHNKVSQKECLSCHSFEELNNIGNWLLINTAKSRDRSVEMIKKNNASPYAPMTLETLKIDEYKLMKSRGMIDQEIANQLGVSFKSFRVWKGKVGLVRRKAVNS